MHMLACNINVYVKQSTTARVTTRMYNLKDSRQS